MDEVAHTFSPVIEAEAGGFCVLGQPGLHSAFQDSQGYVFETLSEKKEKKKLSLQHLT